jgi:hypothetical protein
MIPEPGTVLGDQYKDPVSAIAGLLTHTRMRDFLAADLKTIRNHGILLAHAAVTIVDLEIGKPGCLQPGHCPLLCNENRTGSVR